MSETTTNTATDVVASDLPATDSGSVSTGNTVVTDALGDAGKKALDAERKARADAEKRLTALQKQIDETNAAKAKADEADAEKKGEFERLAADRAEALKQRDAELKTIQDERDALRERVDARDAEDKAMIARWVKDNKGIVDEYLDFYPGEDAPVSAQMAWFNATRPKVEKRAADPARGNGRSPEYANGRDSKADEAAMAAGARQNRNRF